MEVSPPTKAIKVNFKSMKISPDSIPTEVARVTLDCKFPLLKEIRMVAPRRTRYVLGALIAGVCVAGQEAFNEGITSGTLILKGRSGQEKLSVKWRAKPLEGGLTYQGGDPLNFVVRNDFRVPVAIVGFQLQGYPDGDFTKGLQSLHSKVSFEKTVGFTFLAIPFLSRDSVLVGIAEFVVDQCAPQPSSFEGWLRVPPVFHPGFVCHDGMWITYT